MFARMLELTVKPDKKDDIVRIIKAEILPILKKQPGFLEILPFFPEIKNEKVIAVSLWAEKRDAEKYEREHFRKVEELIMPYLEARIFVKPYMVETRLCEHFVQTLVA